MCGICGIIGNNLPVQEKSIRKMMQLQKHRGPDDEGVFVEKNVGLGFVRLSIIDLSLAGHQPMFSHDQRYVIVFNGEIYNYIELRENLKKEGHIFQTNTDTEVLLNSYLYWGKECLNHFNGMWAFVIYDREERKIFAARDRYGIKPFYYFINHDFFAFASEIPPLLSLLPSKPTPDDQSIFDYLVFNRTDQNEHTFFKEIRKLQHGHCISIDIGKSVKEQISLREDISLKIEKWYNLRDKVDNGMGFQSAEEFREVFRSSVGLRLRSDVPVGVCLSGGMDSSAIVSCILKDFAIKDLQTFSVVFGEHVKTDETRFIKLYEDKVYKQHFNKIDAQTFETGIEDFVRALGEPVPSGGPFAQFNVMKIAKGNVTVLLDGQGADEILGGYKYFWGFYYNELIRKFKILQLFKEMKNGGDNFYKLSTSFFYAIPSGLRTYLKARDIGHFIAPEFKKEFSSLSTLADDLYSARSLNQALFNHIEYKLEHLLKWEDRNAMWFGLESRVPFLDFRMVEKALKTKSSMLMNSGFTKDLLRKSMRGDVPETIINRRVKVGFGAPKKEWFEEPGVNNYILNVIMGHKDFLSDYFIWDHIIKAVQEHVHKKKDNSSILWKAFNLALWQKTYSGNLK